MDPDPEEDEEKEGGVGRNEEIGYTTDANEKDAA